MIQKPANTNMHVAISEAYTKFHAKNDCLKRSWTITNTHTIRTRKHKCFQLNNAKIVRANKCNVQRIKTCDNLFLICVW